MDRLKYAHVVHELRFLLPAQPDLSRATTSRRITDRYIAGTRLRLRMMVHDDGAIERKLTQKLPQPGDGVDAVTTIYLGPEEHDLIAGLTAHELGKTRHSLDGFGVDVFEGALEGLVLAEAEVASEEEARAILPPPVAIAEVTADERFSGASLAAALRNDVFSQVAARLTWGSSCAQSARRIRSRFEQRRGRGCNPPTVPPL